MILRAGDTTIYYKSLSLLAASLNDGHAQVKHNFQQTPVTDRVFGKYTAPFNCQIVGDSLVVQHILQQASDSLNIRVGDKIIEVDDMPVESLIKKRMPYVSASESFQGKMAFYYGIKAIPRVFILDRKKRFISNDDTFKDLDEQIRFVLDSKS